MSTTLDLDLRAVSGALGAEIRGLDLEHITDAQFDALHDALCATHAPSELDQRRGLADELAVLTGADASKPGDPPRAPCRAADHGPWLSRSGRAVPRSE